MLRGQPGGRQNGSQAQGQGVETAEPHVSTDALKRYYRDMLLIRRF